MDNIKDIITTVNTVVIGSGAAGFAAAARLSENSISVAIVTEDIGNGTSRNAGSDKQTYYKIGLSGEKADSPLRMAKDLFAGEAVDGDIALCEAALSARCFMYLCELGVPFPHDRYGQYIGYRTDHDTFQRATSAGPLTSKLMTEKLELLCREHGVKIFGRQLAIRILRDNDSVYGLIALDENEKPVLYNCNNVIIATGGPSCIYSDTVYPNGQYGMTSLALNAGAECKNLTQWQYGLASVNPRWNVSGTYMQVLPRFFSVDKNGNEYEFLNEYFKSQEKLLSTIFKKGYEWPFDSKKFKNGSSLIDYLVYIETTQKGRKVYLDYTKNPCGIKDISTVLPEGEAESYLSSAQAMFGTPVERLIQMNEPAYNLYISKGIDLKQQPLEIRLCAQHCNGGINVDSWWQTNVQGLFAVGEAAGTHGVYRPGGSALNAGQVGALRASQYIKAHRNGGAKDEEEFSEKALPAITDELSRILCVNGNEKLQSNLWKRLCEDMSAVGGAIRQSDEFTRQIELTSEAFFDTYLCASSPKMLYRLLDMLTMRMTVLTAMNDYTEKSGGSYGGAVYLKDGKYLKNASSPQVQITKYYKNICVSDFRAPRPVPEDNEFFENVWRQYRENGNVY